MVTEPVEVTAHVKFFDRCRFDRLGDRCSTMPLQMLPSLLLYILALGYTPGPSNLCAFHSGIHFGRGNAMRIWWGFVIGFLIIDTSLVLITHFLGDVLGPYVKWLSYAGAVYMVCLAVMIIVKSGQSKEDMAKSCSVWTGIVIEVTNAKVWMFCLTALGTFVLPYSSSFIELAKVGCLLILAGPIANLVWLVAGSALNSLAEKYGRIIDVILAAALVLCALMLIL